jgi:hypothetical protein
LSIPSNHYYGTTFETDKTYDSSKIKGLRAYSLDFLYQTVENELDIERKKITPLIGAMSLSVTAADTLTIFRPASEQKGPQMINRNKH